MQKEMNQRRNLKVFEVGLLVRRNFLYLLPFTTVDGRTWTNFEVTKVTNLILLSEATKFDISVLMSQKILRS